MNADLPVQRQLDAYNAHDLARFVAEYADDVEVFRMPATTPSLSGKADFAKHYADNRFNRPNLRAEVINRMICGDKVVDHERITGLADHVVETIVVYQVVEGRIRTVWFFQS